MKILKTAAVIFGAVLVSSCNQEGVNKAVELETFQDSVSYSVGVMLAQNIKNQVEDIDVNIVAQALKDALGEKEQLTVEQCQKVFVAYGEKKAAEAGKEGVVYLEENATKEGVKTTATGLQYKILQEGTGKYPTAADKVTVHYTGTLIDGTEFDSSVGGDPISFRLSGVVAGWTEGLQLINEGGKIQLVIPYQLGYGERGSRSIPPKATLVFEVELISIDEQ